MVIRGLIIGLYLFLSVIRGFAGDPVYPAFLIPDSLKENANAVIRNNEVILDIASGSNATYTETLAITILNSRGDEYSEFTGFYDKQRKIGSVSIKIYDALGTLIEKVKNKEIRDYSAISGFSLYEDNRVQYYKPTVRRYPYTAVITYQIHYDGYIQFPYWQPQIASDVSIEKASFILKMPEDNAVKCITRNMCSHPEAKEEGRQQVYTWHQEGVKAFQAEFLQPYMKEVLPVVHVAPLEFSFEGRKGNMKTWKDLGLWIGSLLDGLQELPEETQVKMQELVAGSADTIEMVRRIYDYMQEHTRYVSIQLGIGGFQPFDAKTVDRVGYGDCKALTNYTRALLQSVGIRSVYTIVRAGSSASRIIPDFPAQQFNHVILAVPVRKDTLWLECTNQDIPFGYLGDATDDRWALAITSDGGQLVRTRQYAPDSNCILSGGRIVVDANGNADAHFDVCFSGLQYAQIFNFIHSDADTRKKWIYENLYIPNSRISYSTVDDHPATDPSATLSVAFELEKFGVKSGKRMFITLNPLNAFPDIPAREEKRKYDICIRQSFTHTDSIVFLLPEGYEIEYLPARVELSSDFGEYSSALEQKNGQVVFRRYLKVKGGRYPASDYPNLYDFYKTIIRADKAKLVLSSGI